MAMSEFKQRIYEYELAKIGFPDSEYNTDSGKMLVNADNNRMPDVNDAGDIYFGTEYSHLAINTIGPLVKKVNEMVGAWENARPMTFENLSNFKILAEFNKIILAARDDGEYGRGLHFATWKLDNDGEVYDGYYTEDYTDAKESFALRSGLVQKEKVIAREQAATIKTAIDVCLENSQSYAYSSKFTKINAALCHIYPELDETKKPPSKSTASRNKSSLHEKLDTAKETVRQADAQKANRSTKVPKKDERE